MAGTAHHSRGEARTGYLYENWSVAHRFACSEKSGRRNPNSSFLVIHNIGRRDLGLVCDEREFREEFQFEQTDDIDRQYVGSENESRVVCRLTNQSNVTGVVIWSEGFLVVFVPVIPEGNQPKSMGRSENCRAISHDDVGLR